MTLQVLGWLGSVITSVPIRLPYRPLLLAALRLSIFATSVGQILGNDRFRYILSDDMTGANKSIIRSG